MSVEPRKPWFGVLPSHWDSKPVGRAFDERRETTSDKEHSPLSVTKLGVVDQLGDIALSYDGAPKKLARKDDVVINSRSDRKGSAGVAPRDGSVSVINTVLVSRLIDPGYAHYLLRSRGFQEEFYRFGSGIVADLWSTKYPTMKNIRLPYPPRAEQRQIADYLDRETAEIDEFISEQGTFAGLVQERFYSDWAMRASVLGTGWEVGSLRRVISSIVDGPFGSALTSAHYSDSGTRVIRLGNIGVNEFLDQDAAYIPSEYGKELNAHAASAGDVIVAGLGDANNPLGRASVVPLTLGPAIVKADCYRVRPTEAVNSEYLAWILSSPYCSQQFKVLSRGSTRQRLNTNIVRDVQIPLPPIETQRSVVEASTRARSAVDDTVALTDRAIALAKERRAALISAAVTGKIDVTAKNKPAAEQLEDDLAEAR